MPHAQSSQPSLVKRHLLLVAMVGLACLLVPGLTRADSAGGQASAYTAFQQGVNICTGWKPPFDQDLSVTQAPLTAKSTAVTVTSLTPGTSYMFQVNGIDPNGNLVPIPFTTVVGASQGGPATASASASGTVALTWSGAPGATAFQVLQRGPNDSSFLKSAPQSASQLAAGSTGATIIGLTAGSSYSFEVLAVVANGNTMPIHFSIAGAGSGGPASLVAPSTGTVTLTWMPTNNINSYQVLQRAPTDSGFTASAVRGPEKVTGTFSAIQLFNPGATALTVPLLAAPTGAGDSFTKVITVGPGSSAQVAALPVAFIPPSLSASSLALPNKFVGDVTATGCPRELFAFVETGTVVIDELTGSFSATFDPSIPPPPSCQFWSPLFMNNQNGWTSTLAVHNETNIPVTIRVELDPLGAPSSVVITRNYDLPASGLRQINAADFGLQDGFAGSLVASAVLTPTSPAQACEISGVVYHDAPGADRIALETIPFEGQTLSSVFIPLAFHNANGWNSRVLLRNTDPTFDTSTEVRIQNPSAPLVSQVEVVPAAGAIELDLDAMGAPSGQLTIELRAPSGGGSVAPVVAAAYNFGPGGAADAVNGATSGARKTYLPLLFRRYHGVDSTVTVQNTGTGAVTPRLTLADHDSGATIAVIPAAAPIREGEAFTWSLPTIDALQDGQQYSAIVETDPNDGDVLLSLTHDVNVAAGTSTISLSAAVPDALPAALRVRGLTAPLVFDDVDGLNTGIQIENIETTPQTATLRFFNAPGTQVTTLTVPLPPTGATMVYLPSVAGLPDGFLGSVEIHLTGAAAATVQTVRSPGGGGPATPAT